MLDEGARAALLAHAWPGNVRELKNAIERAALLCRDALVTTGDLGLAAARGNGARAAPAAEPDRAMIEGALSNARGVISQAAAELGLSRQALYRRMEKLGIEAAVVAPAVRIANWANGAWAQLAVMHRFCSPDISIPMPNPGSDPCASFPRRQTDRRARRNAGCRVGARAAATQWFASAWVGAAAAVLRAGLAAR